MFLESRLWNPKTFFFFELRICQQKKRIYFPSRNDDTLGEKGKVLFHKIWAEKDGILVVLLRKVREDVQEDPRAAQTENRFQNVCSPVREFKMQFTRRKKTKIYTNFLHFLT